MEIGGKEALTAAALVAPSAEIYDWLFDKRYPSKFAFEDDEVVVVQYDIPYIVLVPIAKNLDLSMRSEADGGRGRNFAHFPNLLSTVADKENLASVGYHMFFLDGATGRQFCFRLRHTALTRKSRFPSELQLMGRKLWLEVILFEQCCIRLFRFKNDGEISLIYVGEIDLYCPLL